MAEQIKSKDRVADHGEVFTAEREVNAMLDLVKQETERIESRFLEPACGTGNFLVEILRRKLDVVKKRYRSSRPEYEKYSVLAVSSIYGVDLLADNVQECQERLFEIWRDSYHEVCKNDADEHCEEAVRFILQHNILCGNALSMMRVDENGADTEDPIIFAQWDLMTGDLMKRRDYRLDVLMKENDDRENYILFDDEAMNADYWEEDPDTKEMIPKAIREYKPINYWEVQHGEYI